MSESDPMVLRILDVLAAEIYRSPERPKALDACLLVRINSLVGHLDVYFKALLVAEDE